MIENLCLQAGRRSLDEHEEEPDRERRPNSLSGDAEVLGIAYIIVNGRYQIDLATAFDN